MLPIRLKLENFMSYDQAELEFDFDSALIVGETNDNERQSSGAGKSSILESVGFVLFGETRHKAADSVVRRRQMMCRVELVFSHDNRIYRVVRTRNVKNSKMEVQFEELKGDGSVADLTHDTNKQTDAEIRRIIRSNNEIFINSSYFRQNAFVDFMEGTFATRQAIIGSMLGLDKWGEYQKKAKENFKELSEAIERKKAELDHLIELGGQIAVLEQQELVAKASVDKLTQEEAGLHDEARVLELKIAENKDAAAQFKRFRDFQQRLENHRQQMKQAELGIGNRQQLVDKLKNDVAAGENAVEAMSIEIKRLTDRIADFKPQDTAQMEEKLVVGKTEQRILTQQIANLQQNDTCQMCGYEWKDEEARSGFVLEKQHKLEEVQEKLKRAEPKLAAIRAAAVEAKRIQDEIREEQRSLGAVDKNVEFAKLKKQSLEEEIVAASKQLDVLSGQLAELEKLSEGAQAVEKVELADVERQLEQRKTRMKSVRALMSDGVYKLGALDQERKSLVKRQDGKAEIEAELSKLSRLAAVYGQLSRVFSKDGIQAIIIDNIVEDLTQQTNYWLAQFGEPTHINFITQKLNTKGDWRETFDLEFNTPTGPSQFEDFSGGERFKITFAIRLALSTIQAKRMGGEIQLLMLDEVSSVLDPAGMETFVQIIRRLEKEMKVMVITHDDRLKDEFEHIITVKKTPNGSTIV